MTEEEARSIELCFKILALFATFLAILIALFKDDIVFFIKKPTLTLEEDPNSPSSLHIGTEPVEPPWFIRLIVRNDGRGTATGVQAQLIAASPENKVIFSNPIQLRWSGTVGTDQKVCHIPRGTGAPLDIFMLMKDGGAAPVQWRNMWVATIDEVVNANNANPYTLHTLGTDPSSKPMEPYVFTLKLYNTTRVLAEYALQVDRGNGTMPPKLSFKKN